MTVTTHPSPFYQIPAPGRAVRWPADAPQTLVRFGPRGSLVLLHVSSDPELTVARWLTQAARIALSGLDGLSAAGEVVPPVLLVRLSGAAPLAAPVCLLELGCEQAGAAWLNARPLLPELRLVLLRRDPELPGQARVEARRRVWEPEWQAGDEQLRLSLERQLLDVLPDEAGEVQARGRALVAQQDPAVLLRGAGFSFALAGAPPPTQSDT